MTRNALILALSIALVPVAAVGSAADAAPKCQDSAADFASASTIAAQCGQPVEVTASRTETGQIFVNPDGSGTVEEYAFPQRVRRADGSWSALDATLNANPDGTYSPRATTVDLVFSGGGSTPLISGRRGDQAVSLSWPGTLPVPRVAGASATYADVLPGVDLVVTAEATGFGEVLVVKNRAAAANPAVRQLALGASLSGLRWARDGGQMQAVDGAGRPVLAATAPRMWDSAPAAGGAALGGRARGDVRGPAEGGRSAPMSVDIANGRVSIEPDASMLDDPNIQFPLFLDPTIAYSSWTMINSEFPSQSYWSYDKTDCPSGFSSECAKVGQAYGLTMDYRSMFQFATSGFHGKIITGAKFTIDILHSAYSAASTTELRQVNATLGSGTTWSNNASAWSGTIAASVSNSDSTDVRKLTEISGGSLVSIIQSVANGSATSTTWGLKAATETSDSGWKKFDAKTAKLVVDINTAPNTPDTLTVDGKACVSGANRPVIATATPVLKAHVTDPDGDSMDAWFAWAKWNGSSFVDVASTHQTPVTNGGYAQVTTGTLVDGGIYTFRSQTNDSPSHSTGSGTSPVTNMPGNCEWEVDLTNPAVPTVTGDVYKENSVGCPAEGCGSVGQTGRFTFSSSADVASFKWGWTSPPSTVLNPATTGGTVTLDWTPPSGGAKTLYVQAIDRAGRTATKTYQFYVAPPSPAVARWKLDEWPGSTTLLDDTGHGHDATPAGGVTLGAPGRIVPGFDGATRTSVAFDGTSGYLTASADAMPDTSKSYSVAAWVRLGDLSVNRTALSQGGTNTSAFFLEYHQDTAAWQFTTSSADSSTATYASAKSTSPPRLGTWTHLVGVYDSAAKTLTLYVNGVAEGTASGVTSWDAGQPLRISGYSPWLGSIAEVQVWSRVISATEVANLVDPLQVGRVAEWHMDEVGPGPAFDASGLAHDLTFYNGAQIPASGAGQTGTGLRLDGIDDYATPDGPVVNTDQSFTVSAWVRPAVATGWQTFVEQESAGSYAGFLLYYGAPEAQWKFKMFASSADNSGTTATLVTAPAPDIASYHHLVAVFDAQKREVRIYVDGTLGGTKAMNAAWQPWNAAGSLVLGHSQSPSGPTDLAHADIDEVRIYQGVVADVTRIP
jgi:hypothetical protein